MLVNKHEQQFTLLQDEEMELNYMIKHVHIRLHKAEISSSYTQYISQKLY